MFFRKGLIPRHGFQGIRRLPALLFMASLLAVPYSARLPHPAVQSSAPEQPACILTAIDEGFFPGVSLDGRFVVYKKGMVLPGHTDYTAQAFLYHIQNGQMEPVSLSHDGELKNNQDEYLSPPAVSADGRFVAFFSNAADLTPTPGGWSYQLYLRDRLLKTTELVSRTDDGPQVGGGWNPAISADGNFIAYQNWGDHPAYGDSNSGMDVYLRDRRTGRTERISIASDGSQGEDNNDYGYSTLAISDDGNLVAFPYPYLKDHDGTWRGGIFLRDRAQAKTEWLAPGHDPAMTPDGRFLTFVTSEGFDPADQNEGADVYVLDRQSRTFELVSVSSRGEHSAGMHEYREPALSNDGQWVVFASKNPEIGPDQNETLDIFLRDRQKKTTTLLSISAAGVPGNDDSHSATISADGRYVAFVSMATNLVPGATTARMVYLCQRVAPLPDQAGQVYLPMLFHGTK